jgi:hypothetical protein
MRKPRVKNKYNLTIPQIKKLVIKDRSQVCAPLFWRNNVISAWCISGHAGSDADEEYGTDNTYWIGIYDEDTKAYRGKFRFEFSTYGGMCGYRFNKFFQPADIECENDLLIQERFLEKINELLDKGILEVPK